MGIFWVIAVFIVLYVLLRTGTYKRIIWILGTLIFLAVLIVIAWLLVGPSLFMMPVRYDCAPGVRRMVAENLYVIDSNNVDCPRLAVLLPGICGPLPSHQEKSAKQWAKRMMVIVRAGYRVLLVEHRWGLFQNNLYNRIRDLQDVWTWLRAVFPGYKAAIVGASTGALIAAKWAARTHLVDNNSLANLAGIALLVPSISLKNAVSHLVLPYFLRSDPLEIPGTDSRMHSVILRELGADSDTSTDGDELFETFSADDTILLPMNLLVGIVPLMLVYCREDPSSDYTVWENWHATHAKAPWKRSEFSHLPTVELCCLRNRTKLRGIDAHCHTALADSCDWLPRLASFFSKRK